MENGPGFDERRKPVRLMHRGGWSDTFEALVEGVGRVAVKVAWLGDDPVGVEYVGAAEAVRRRGPHPALVEVRSAELAQGHLVVEREYVDGVDVATAISGGERPEPSAALAVGAAVADGLCALHEGGFIGRRVSPSHVLLGRSGGVKLLHGGLPSPPTRARESRRDVVTAEIEYAAPECFAGSTPDAAADVYSVAAVTFALMHGMPPVTATHRLRRILERKGAMAVAEDSSIAPSDPAADTVLRAALLSAPEDRPAIESLRDTLAHAADPGEIPLFVRIVIGAASVRPGV